MNVQAEIAVENNEQERGRLSRASTSMFPYLSPEFVPVLFLIAMVGFAVQTFNAVSVAGWSGVVSDPLSSVWSGVWFLTCCVIYSKTFAPHLERSHGNLGNMIHVACIYTFFSATSLCLRIFLITIN